MYVLPYLLGAAMAATLGVFFAGIISFAFGNPDNRALATRLMTVRVVLQGIAVAVFAVMMAISLV
jgi:hypothetical protein